MCSGIIFCTKSPVWIQNLSFNCRIFTLVIITSKSNFTSEWPFFLSFFGPSFSVSSCEQLQRPHQSTDTAIRTWQKICDPNQLHLIKDWKSIWGGNHFSFYLCLQRTVFELVQTSPQYYCSPYSSSCQSAKDGRVAIHLQISFSRLQVKISKAK